MCKSLAICKRIVKAHEGSITFESIRNQGSTFMFTLSINQSSMLKEKESIFC